MAQKNRKVKILFTIPNFDTAGSGKALLKVAQNLNTAIFEPHIMCQHDKGSFINRVKDSGIPVHIAQYTCQMKPYHMGLWNCYKISKIFRKISPDIIHSFHYSADYSEPLAAKMAGIKWVYTKKNMSWGGASKNGWRLRSFLANAIVAQNTDMLSQFFPNSTNTYLIPRGVDIEEFKPIKPMNHLRKLWHISDEKRILICVANLVPVKGIEIVIKTFDEVSKKQRDWILLIVGDYDSVYGKEMMQLSKILQLENKIIFTGKQANISEYLSIAEVFVLPTLDRGRKEGSPVALLEAMACGKYVLASNIAGIKDQLQPFPEHLVKAGDIKVWGYALKKAFELSKEALESKGKEFCKYVTEQFKISDEVAKTEKLYTTLIE